MDMEGEMVPKPPLEGEIIPKPKFTDPNASGREKGVTEFIAALQNVKSSSPEVLSAFARALQRDLSTGEHGATMALVEAIKALEALERAARVMGSIPGQARTESPPKQLSE